MTKSEQTLVLLEECEALLKEIYSGIPPEARYMLPRDMLRKMRGLLEKLEKRK